MITFLLLSTALLILLGAATVRAVSRDGRGHLPPVKSHYDWDESGTETPLASVSPRR